MILNFVSPSRRNRDPKATGRNLTRNRARCSVESLEGRQLMTTIPTFATVANTTGAAPIILAPMEQTTVTGALTATTPSNSFRVSLTANETVDISETLAFSYPGGGSAQPTLVQAPSILSVTDPRGVATTTSSSSSRSNLVDYTFKAPASGMYAISIQTSATGNQNLVNFPGLTAPYTAEVRPIMLDPTTDAHLDPNHNAADAAKLSDSGGGLYAFPDANPNYLDISGPTGRGFQLAGNWRTSVAGNGAITYTANGNVALETALGEIPLPLTPQGAITIVTKPGMGNGLYGEVASTSVSIAGMPIGSLISQVGNAFDFTTALSNISGGQANVPSVSWGIALGDTLNGAGGTTLNDSTAPLNPAVPYLYFTSSSTIGYTYGQAQLSVGASGVGFDAVIDPADPMFYFHETGSQIVSDFAIGGSWNDLLPYTATNAIQHWNASTFYGDFLVEGQLNIGDLTDDAVPLLISGAMTFNLDPNHLGSRGVIDRYATDLSSVVTSSGHSTWGGITGGIGRVSADLTHIQVGSNSNLSLGLNQDGLSLSIPLSQGSAVWDGPANTAYFRNQTAQPFQGTLLASILPSPSFAWDGRINMNTGNFDVGATASYTVFGQMLANATFAFGNEGIFISGEVVHAEVFSAYGITATVSMDTYADFLLDSSGYGCMSVNASINNASMSLGGTSLGTISEQYSWNSGQINVAQLGSSIWNTARTGLENLLTTDFTPLINEWNSFTQDVQTAAKKVSNWFHKTF